MATKPVSILLIDDDEIEAELVRRSLKKSKIANDIYHATDGVEGLEILRGQHETNLPSPFLILLDLNMPRMNGIEFLGELRSDVSLRKAIVFILTTSNDERDRKSAYEFNPAGYIVKSNAGPNFLELIDLVESYWRIVEFPTIPE